MGIFWENLEGRTASVGRLAETISRVWAGRTPKFPGPIQPPWLQLSHGLPRTSVFFNFSCNSLNERKAFPAKQKRPTKRLAKPEHETMRTNAGATCRQDAFQAVRKRLCVASEGSPYLQLTRSPRSPCSAASLLPGWWDCAMLFSRWFRKALMNRFSANRRSAKAKPPRPSRFRPGVEQLEHRLRASRRHTAPFLRRPHR